jgi:hypothetical protein
MEDDLMCNSARILTGLNERNLLKSALATEMAARMMVCEKEECAERQECFLMAHKTLACRR